MLRNSGDIVSIAIEVKNENKLWKLDKTRSLTTIISNLIKENNLLGSPDDYGLSFLHIADNRLKNKFVTEKNKDKIIDACILKLVESPEILTQNIFKAIRLNNDREIAFQNLNTYLNDETVLELIFIQGFYEEITLFMKNDSRISELEMMICLRVYLNLLKHNFLSNISTQIVNKIIRMILHPQSSPEILTNSVAVIRQLLTTSTPELFDKVILKVKIYEHLRPLLWNVEHPVLQCNVLSLINCYVRQARSNNERVGFICMMNSSSMKDTIFKNVINAEYEVRPELERELHVYQTYILSLLLERWEEKIDINDKNNKKLKELNEDMSDLFHINTLCRTVSINDISYTCEDPNITKKAKFFIGEDFPESPLLTSGEPGFYHGIDTESFWPSPNLKYNRKTVAYLRSESVESFSKVRRKAVKSVSVRSKPLNLEKRIRPMLSHCKSKPFISKLTLDCLIYFKKRFWQSYYTLMKEFEVFNVDFFLTCDRVCLLICEEFNIGKSPRRNGSFCPLVFIASTLEPFFEEFFCRVVWLLSRTRIEMHARTYEDHEKVLDVLKKQISEVLIKKPKTYQALTWNMKMINYSNINLIRQKERIAKWQQILYETPSVDELRKKIEPEIIELIKENRFNFLMQGENFTKFDKDKKSKQVSMFIQLSSNRHRLIIGEWDMEKRQLINNKDVLLSEVTHLIMGKACPHVKENRSKNANLAFSIRLENDNPFDVEAQSQKIFDIWTDGLNALLGKEMESQTYRDEFIKLSEMELTLLLLDIEESVPLPKDPPPVPIPPPHYSFCVH